MHPEGINDGDAVENAKDQLRKELFEIIASNPHGHLDEDVRFLFAAKLQAFAALCGEQFDRSDILVSIGPSIFGVDLSKMSESLLADDGPKTHVETLENNAPPTGNEQQRERDANSIAEIDTVPSGWNSLDAMTLVEMFGYLELSDVVKKRPVSKALRDAVTECPADAVIRYRNDTFSFTSP